MLARLQLALSLLPPPLLLPKIVKAPTVRH
jgi:hypothetical protein